MAGVTSVPGMRSLGPPGRKTHDKSVSSELEFVDIVSVVRQMRSVAQDDC